MYPITNSVIPIAITRMEQIFFMVLPPVLCLSATIIVYKTIIAFNGTLIIGYTSVIIINITLTF